MSVLFATHPRYLEHLAGPGHPERPARLEAVLAAIRFAGFDEALIPLEPVAADRSALERVHPAAYLDALARLAEAGGGRIDEDTTMNEASWSAALLAAGAGLAAAAALQRGAADAAFCAVRPPGHHATARRAMGFCFVNNAAVVARWLADQGERVLIADIDAHHGNGTQDIFYDDPSVMYLSFHEYPLYPGTGRLDEIGHGLGLGTTMNLPFPEGTTGDVYLRALDEVVAPMVRWFCPSWLVISAGFDAHRRDPLTGLGLTSGDYADVVGRLLEMVPAGRRLVILEGGYDLQALADSSAAVIGRLLGVDHRPEPATHGGPGGTVVAAATRTWARLVDP